MNAVAAGVLAAMATRARARLAERMANDARALQFSADSRDS